MTKNKSKDPAMNAHIMVVICKALSSVDIDDTTPNIDMSSTELDTHGNMVVIG